MPRPTYREIPLTFNLGQVSSYEASLLPDGAVATLENWVPEETGGVRVREGWRKSPLIGGPSTSRGLGLGIFTATRRIFRQRKTGSGLAPNETIGVTWDAPTKAGSTLILKVVYTNNSVAAVIPDAQAYGGWQWVHFGDGGSSPVGAVFVFIKENAASETTSSVNFDLHPTNASWIAEGVELTSVQTSAPKNILPSVASNCDAPGPAFTLFKAGWGGTLDPTPNTVEKKSGVSCFAITSTVVAEETTRTGVDGVSVSPSTDYTASFFAKIDTTGETFRCRVKWYDNAGALISNTDGATSSATTAYARYTATGTSPANAVYAAVSFEVVTAAGTSRTRFWDEAQLELGTSATAWERGKITALDKNAVGEDNANPVSTIGGSATVSSSWAEATILWFQSSEGSGTGISSAGWTNSFTEATDLFADGPNYDQYLTSASKVIVGLNSIDTAATITNIAAQNNWASVLNVRLSTSDAVSLDKFYVSAHDATTALNLYYISQSDIDTGPYTLIESNSVAPDGSPVAFATGLGGLLYTNTSFASVRRWGGLGETPTALTPTAGSCIAFFKSRFFIGGAADQPTRLVYSDIGSSISYPAANFLEVGQDDGYTITDIAVQENLLIIGKGNSIWSLYGSGPDNFILYNFPYGDVAPGRAIGVTPNGAIVAGQTDVWQVSGTTIDSISKSLGAAYRPTGRVHVAYADNHAYVLDVAGQKMFVVDLRTQSWHIEKFSVTVEQTFGTGLFGGGLFGSGSLSVGNQPVALLTAGVGRILSSPTSSTDTGLVFYRDHPSLTRTRDFVPLMSQSVLDTGVFWAAGPTATFTPRWLFLQIRQRGDTGGNITFEETYDNSIARSRTLEARGSGVHRFRVDIGRTRGVSSARFRLTGPSEGNQFDVESAVLGFEDEVRS